MKWLFLRKLNSQFLSLVLLLVLQVTSKLKKVMKKKGWLGLADGSYQGEAASFIIPPRNYKNHTQRQQHLHQALAHRRIKIENFIGRLKNFKTLSSTWRHSVVKHRMVFNVIMNTVCIDLHFKPLRKTREQRQRRGRQRRNEFIRETCLRFSVFLLDKMENRN